MISFDNALPRSMTTTKIAIILLEVRAPKMKSVYFEGEPRFTSQALVLGIFSGSHRRIMYKSNAEFSKKWKITPPQE